MSAFWRKFKNKESESINISFEGMCRQIFKKCHRDENGNPPQLHSNPNHKGLEADPIHYEGEWIGFQAKFSEDGGFPYADFKDSLEKAIEEKEKDIHQLTVFYIYSNKDYTNTSDSWKNILNLAIKNNIKIKTKCGEELQELLDDNKLEYLDLIDTYFEGAEGLISQLTSHTKNVLNGINTEIKFQDKSIKIDNSEVISEINNNLNTNSLVLVGDGGVGKTALIKEIYAQYLEKEMPFFVFKALEFNVNTVDQFFGQFGNSTYFTLNNFQTIFKQYNKKIIVIDSAERLGEVGNNYEIFSSILRSLKDNNWTLIFTTRTVYFEQLQNQLNAFNLSFKKQLIPKIEQENLLQIASNYNFKLPDNTRVKEVLAYPFYLNEYLKNYSELQNLNSLKQFKDRLWDIGIAGKNDRNLSNIPEERQACFRQIIKEKIKHDEYYIDCDSTDYNKKALSELKLDGILNEKNRLGQYFITHDIYEEWGLENNIEKLFNKNQYNYNEFFSEIGDRLLIRKAFANWLYEGLSGEDSDEYYNLLKKSLTDPEIRKIWKDEVILALLKSNFASDFIENSQDLITENNFELLKRFLFILRLGCKELDQELINTNKPKNNYYSEFYYKIIDYGNGWQSVINFIFQNKDKFEINDYKLILNVLWDWNYRNKAGETTKQVGLIALYLYQLILKDRYYPLEELKGRLFETITNASSEIKDKLSELIDHVISEPKSRYRIDFDFTVFLLSDWYNTQEVCKYLPEKIIELAKAFWLEEPKKREWFEADDIEIDGNYGISNNFYLKYFSANHFKTPVLNLLTYSPKIAIDFIIDFINGTTLKYIKSKLVKDYNEAYEIQIEIDKNIVIKQYAGARLYDAFRGIPAPQSDLITSILMALESWLLDLVKIDSELCEKICIDILKRSNSVSTTAVLISIFLAYPNKLFKLGLILAKSRDLFLLDKQRYVAEISQSRIYPNWYNDPYHEIFKKFNELQHRKNDLEAVVRNYQFNIYKIPGTDFEVQRKQIEDIIDFHYKKQKEVGINSDEDETWSMFLARIDARKMNPTIVEENGDLLIHFNPALTETQKKTVEKAQTLFDETHKYTKLFLSSSKKKNNEPIDQKYQYDNNPQKAFKELKKIDKELKSLDSQDWRRFQYIKILGDSSYVLLRDHNKDLQKNQLEDLVEIVLKTIHCISNFNWQYQIESGYESSILALVEIDKIFPELESKVRFYLFFLLLSQENQIIAFIIKAILELNKTDEKASLIITKAYLEFKPIWEQAKQDNRVKNIPKGEILYQKYMQYKFEVDGKLNNIFLEQNENQIKQFFENKSSFNFENLDKLEPYHLYRLFAIIPSDTSNPEYLNIARKIIKRLPKIIYADKDHQNYNIRHKFIEKLVDFILNREVNELEDCLKPLLENFTISDHTKDVFEAFVTHQEEHSGVFWEVWNLFYLVIIEKIKTNNSRDSREILRSYLFCNIQLNEHDTKWGREQKTLLQKLVNDLANSPTLLFCLCKLGVTVYKDLVDEDFINWIKTLIIAITICDFNFEDRTVYYLEKVMVNYYNQNTKQLKQNKELRGTFIEILNFLVEKGSIQGFRLRDEV